MGNSESVIVSRHERKHRSGGRSNIRVMHVDQEHYHHKRRRHNPSSESDASSRRSSRKVRIYEPKSRPDDDMRRPTGARYSRDYSYGGYGGNKYIVDQGSVVPGIHQNSPAESRLKSGPTLELRSSGHAYNPAGPKQRRPHISSSGRSYIPQQRQPSVSIPLYRDGDPAHRPDQWSRIKPSIQSYNQPSRGT